MSPEPSHARTATNLRQSQDCVPIDTLTAGERVGNPTGQRTICDAIMTPIPNAVNLVRQTYCHKQSNALTYPHP